MKKEKLEEFPSRIPISSNISAFFIPAGEKWGYNFKLKLRDVAKKSPIYFQKIFCPICGRDDNGKEIPIDTVGKWLFGVPGYMGHIRAFDGHIEIPVESPALVYNLIKFCIKNFPAE